MLPRKKAGFLRHVTQRKSGVRSKSLGTRDVEEEKQNRGRFKKAGSPSWRDVEARFGLQTTAQGGEERGVAGGCRKEVGSRCGWERLPLNGTWDTMAQPRTGLCGWKSILFQGVTAERCDGPVCIPKRYGKKSVKRPHESCSPV